MKQTSRVLSVLLALLMVFSITAIAAEALTITSATYDGADLEGAAVPAGSSITLVFSNNVTDASVLDNNIAKVKVRDAEGGEASAVVSAGDKNTLVVTLGSDLPKGGYTLTIGKDLQAKNGTTLGTKVEYAFTVKGTGGGTGGGNNPLTIDSILVDGEPLEGKAIGAGAQIVIRFSRGMTENAAENLKQIKVLKADGSEAAYTSAANTNKEDENAKREYIVTIGDNEDGALTLVIGAGVKANNGNTLGEDVKTAFTFKAAEAPVEPANPTFLDRVKAFLAGLKDQIVLLFNSVLSGYGFASVKAFFIDLFNRIFPKVMPIV